MRIALVDHEDSFTFNLYHDLGEAAGCEPVVFDSRAVDPADLLGGGAPDLVVLSAGPGHPGLAADAGRSLDVIDACLGRVALFGVCFGLQLMVQQAGGRVVPASEVIHGRSLPVRHSGQGLFAGLPSRVEMMRYHSLVADRAQLPAAYAVVAESEDGEIMALEHREAAAWGVQFHPESVGSPWGRRLLANLVKECRRKRTPGG